MKRILLILLPLFLLVKTGEMSSFAQQLDSARMNALSSRLSEYFEALKHESLDVQKAECDFLIDDFFCKSKERVSTSFLFSRIPSGLHDAGFLFLFHYFHLLLHCLMSNDIIA